jgi:hypothetical protein
MASPDPLPFDESVDLLRARIRDADALNSSAVHSFKELMSDYADRLPDNWYDEALDELLALGHVDEKASFKVFGGDAGGRLSADGRAYLRSQEAR